MFERLKTWWSAARIWKKEFYIDFFEIEIPVNLTISNALTNTHFIQTNRANCFVSAQNWQWRSNVCESWNSAHNKLFFVILIPTFFWRPMYFAFSAPIKMNCFATNWAPVGRRRCCWSNHLVWPSICPLNWQISSLKFWKFASFRQF